MNTTTDVSDKEALEAVTELVNACYSRGVNDALKGVAFGGIGILAGCAVVTLISEWKARKNQINLFGDDE